jgi:hypothetical protein
MRKQLNLFSLHGDYYQNNENRLTANFIFLLSEFRYLFMPPLLQRLNIFPSAKQPIDLACADCVFQENISTLQGNRRPDAEIRVGDTLRIVFKAKVGANPLDPKQLTAYAKNLRDSGTTIKRLVCVTQANERGGFDDVVKAIEPAILPPGTMVYIRWYEILDMIRSGARLNNRQSRRIAKRICEGRAVEYPARLCSLFLEEVQRDMYDKKFIDELPGIELPDVVLSTQTAWFMRAARRFRVWFPKGGVANPNPAKYVAYYEVDDGKNKHPKQISFVARNRIWWNHLSFEDAIREEELEHIFRDEQLRRKPPSGRHSTSSLRTNQLSLSAH